MALVRCPICGEEYSDSYDECPFCEEEEVMERGAQIRRSSRRGGKRAAGGQMSILTPTLVLLIVVMLALLAYLLFGDVIAEKLGLDKSPDVQTEETFPEEIDPPVEGDPMNPDLPVPDEPGVPDAPVVEEPPVVTTMDYAAAAALPKGLSLSTTDFSLMAKNANHTIKASGGSGRYQWFSENPDIATVDETGKVTAVSRGTVNIVVTDGEKKGTCIVRCNFSSSSSSSAAPSDPVEETPSTAGLQAGAGKVVNAGNGIRVRAEANTSSEILATLPNGADVQIVKSAGNGWYQITFSDVGGVTTSGYMKGDYLKNK